MAALRAVQKAWHDFQVFWALSVWTMGLVVATIAPAIAVAGIFFFTGVVRWLAVGLLTLLVRLGCHCGQASGLRPGRCTCCLYTLGARWPRMHSCIAATRRRPLGAAQSGQGEAGGKDEGGTKHKGRWAKRAESP